MGNAESVGMLRENVVGGEEHSESSLALSIFVIGEVIFILWE